MARQTHRKKTLRIGLLGGSFDPPHAAHLVIAKTAKRQLRLDRVLFVPAYLPPHKRKGTSASPRDRLAMVRRALKGKRGFAISDIEIRRRGVSFTAVTLRSLRKRFPRAEFWLLIGSDNVRQFHTWKWSEEIARNATLAVYRRKGGGVLRKNHRAKVITLRGPIVNLSSSAIRTMIARDRSVRGLVSEPVLQYIVSKKLYCL